MNKVLIISPDVISRSMAGPGVRYWNFAKELSKHFSVVLLSKNKDTPPTDNFEIWYRSEVKQLATLVKDFNVIIVQGLALLEMPFLKKCGIPLVIDLYDPFILEVLEHLNGDFSYLWTQYKETLSILTEQIIYGDFFICASEKQKDFWLGFLAANMRINPIVYKDNPRLENLVGIVPFGLPEVKPQKYKQLVKGVIKGIERDDKLVLWWGGLWDWLDPMTLVKAMKIVSEGRKDIKCLIVGIKHPDPSFLPHKIVEKVLKETDKLGLTNSVIYFKDWINYDERQEYLKEADIGVSLHYDILETRYSFRTRVLDYLWCELPMIVTQGDVMAELVHEHSLGFTIAPQDYQALAKYIIQMADNNDEYGKRFASISERYLWSEVTMDLVRFCAEPKLAVDRGKVFRVKPPSRVRKYLSKGLYLLMRGEYKALLKKITHKFNIQ